MFSNNNNNNNNIKNNEIISSMCIEQQQQQLSQQPPSPQPQEQQQQQHVITNIPFLFLSSSLLSLLLLITTTSFPSICYGDEYGIEKEAPTLYTGETVEICTKRGPLGACLKTEFRTEENDNDIAKKYFRNPTTTTTMQTTRTTTTNEKENNNDNDDDSSNELINRLRQQTEMNKEKNKLDVERRTFLNDQSANFGPFDRQVIIMNTDGKTFTLLQNPQAMRLKRAGFIQDRQFIKQPTIDEIEQALEGDIIK